MALAEMSTILAHEIRNPLASMELFAEVIAKEPAQASEWVSHLRAGIRSFRVRSTTYSPSIAEAIRISRP